MRSASALGLGELRYEQVSCYTARIRAMWGCSRRDLVRLCDKEKDLQAGSQTLALDLPGTFLPLKRHGFRVDASWRVYARVYTISTIRTRLIVRPLPSTNGIGWRPLWRLSKLRQDAYADYRRTSDHANILCHGSRHQKALKTKLG